MRKKFNFNFAIAGIGLIAYILGIIQDEMRVKDEEEYIEEQVRKEVDRRLKESSEEES